MPESNQFDKDFFRQPTQQVARGLLGARLVRLENEQRTGGLIVETEAYRGEDDLGCHARAGITPRTQVMYGPPGTIYVYFNYGMHWLLNFVTEEEGFPGAVLIRALLPTEGIAFIASRRKGRPRPQWTNGPGKLCQALAIDKRFNGQSLFASDAELFLEPGTPVSDSSVTIGPRVGLTNVPEPWKSMPWRFQVHKNSVSSLLADHCLTHRRKKP
jgi:DNA-3-methyladenine glycosylase